MLPKCSAAAKPGTLHNVCWLRREGMGAAGKAGRGGPCYPHVPRPWEGAGVPCPNPEVALGTLCSHSQQQTAPGRSESRGCTWDHGLRQQGLHPLPEPRARWVATDPSPPFPSLTPCLPKTHGTAAAGITHPFGWSCAMNISPFPCLQAKQEGLAQTEK